MAHRNQGSANGERLFLSNSILEPRHINLKRTRAQSLLVTPLCEVTCVATTSPCTEHAKLKRQNGCLESVCKCNGTGVSHLVADKIYGGQGGVRLVILHSTHHSAQLISRELSHTTVPVPSKFCLQGHACEGARNLCATARPVCCTRTCPLSPIKKRDPSRHPKHEMSRCKHVR